MKEFLDTIIDELKRMVSEGENFTPLDDESVENLKKMANSGPKEVSTGRGASRKTSVLVEEKNSIDDGLSEVKFASPEDLKVGGALSGKAEIRAKVVRSGGEFSVAPIPMPVPFSLPDGDKRSKWEFLMEKVLSDKVCNEHLKPGKKVVFGVGNLDADIFFCGEAPGADEEIQGEPFVGRAGQLLTKIIKAMGLERRDVYIGNIMNWRPELPTSKGNRPPTEEEMRYCLPYLKAQIEIVNPKVVVALGNTAVSGLLGPDPTRRLGKIRGKWSKFENRDLMITYHPSYLLQYGTPSTKRLVWEDMLLVMEKVGLPISDKQRRYFLG